MAEYGNDERIEALWAIKVRQSFITVELNCKSLKKHFLHSRQWNMQKYTSM